jgi:glycosyltransferase involved in cell wall biosynthesis
MSSSMKILFAHNRYLHAGGEDMAYEAEAALLLRHGHEVARFLQDNLRVHRIGRASAAVLSVWSPGSRERLLRVLERERPMVAHFHNTFPLISPSAYHACRDAGVPVVQSLHNFRLLCAGALLFRDGRACEDCMGRSILWPGVVHGCYRSSRLETAGVTVMLQTHRILGTWNRRVDLFIALSEFSRRKFIEGGLPAQRILVKPNFVHPDPGIRAGGGEYALYAGRLSAEKGVRTLFDAWRLLKGIPLLIAGDGPLLEYARRRAQSNEGGRISVLGRLSRNDVFSAMKNARFLVFPSLCYENFPLAVVEAFACGLPVACSDAGAAVEIVEDGRTGAHFHASDPQSLADAASRLWSDPSGSLQRGRNARAEFEEKYTEQRNYGILRQIYSRLRDW